MSENSSWLPDTEPLNFTESAIDFVRGLSTNFLFGGAVHVETIDLPAPAPIIENLHPPEYSFTESPPVENDFVPPSPSPVFGNYKNNENAINFDIIYNQRLLIIGSSDETEMFSETVINMFQELYLARITRQAANTL